MTEQAKIQALVRCQIECAGGLSYPLHLVRMYKGQPICKECYYEDEIYAGESAVLWSDLPPVKLEDLEP